MTMPLARRQEVPLRRLYARFLDDASVRGALLLQGFLVGRARQFRLHNAELDQCNANSLILANSNKFIDQLLDDVGWHVGWTDPAECGHLLETGNGLADRLNFRSQRVAAWRRDSDCA